MFAKKPPPTSRERAALEFAYLSQAPDHATDHPRLPGGDPLAEMVSARRLQPDDLDNVMEAEAEPEPATPVQVDEECAASVERHERLTEWMRRLGLTR